MLQSLSPNSLLRASPTDFVKEVEYVKIDNFS
jgi:hypothetical protein